MATLLSRSTWTKISVFHKNGIFLLKNVFISDFLARIRNQPLRIDPCAKFQPNRPFSLRTLPRFQTEYTVMSIALEALRQVIWGKFCFYPMRYSKFIHVSHFDEDILVWHDTLQTQPRFYSVLWKWPIGEKIRKLEFWPGTIPKTAWWRHAHLLVMTSARFFERFCPRVPSCEVWF